MKKRIHVNQHIIKQNKSNPKLPEKPPLTIKTYKDNHKAYRVEVLGPSRVVYQPERPLSCGATVWVETDSPVVLDEEAR